MTVRTTVVEPMMPLPNDPVQTTTRPLSPLAGSALALLIGACLVAMLTAGLF